MRIHLLPNPKPRIDLGRTFVKNLVDVLVKPAQELVKSVTETSSKLQEFKTYDQEINYSIY